MSPRFVDMNGDGHDDFLVGTFDGSPHIAFATAHGLKAPDDLLDKNRKRIISGAFWNLDKGNWDSSARCQPKGLAPEASHGSSAEAIDWDGDGDFDLVLGDHRGGYVFLRENEGNAHEWKFADANRFVLFDGKPLIVASGVTTVRAVDWNKDGLFDLVIGSMGDCFGVGDGLGGGVDLYLNSGKKSAPVFKKRTTLIPREKLGGTKPTRPDTGLYPDAGDIDGDGDLDLIVGGYSHWTPIPHPLTSAEERRVDALSAEIEKLNERETIIRRAIEYEGLGLPKDVARQRMHDLFAQKEAELDEIKKRLRKATTERDLLSPPKQRTSSIWLYINESKR